MVKRALCAVVGLFSLCLSLSAQQADGADGSFRTLNINSLLLPSLALSDGESFAFPVAFSWMAPESPDVVLPPLTVKGPRGVATTSPAPPAEGFDSSKGDVTVRRSNPFDYVHGEVGVLVGASTGKFGQDFEQGYITGEVGNDKLHISAGASYERWGGRPQRFGH